MPTHPPIFILTGKNPATVTGGYASYAGSLHGHITKLHYPVTVITLPPNPFGMVALLPFSIFLFIRLLLYTSSSSIIWGIGPWALAGALLKFFRPHTILIADYFTTIKHEFTGGASEAFSHPYPLWLKIITLITSFTLIPFYSLLEKFSLNQSNYIITHYHSTETILKRQFHLPHSRFTRLPYSPQLPRLAEARLSRAKAGPKLPQLPNFSPPHPALILTICRHDPRKGVADLLEAYALLHLQGINFSATIVGSGPLLNFHRRQARQLNLDNVSIPGSIPNITPYLKSASLFVLPSLEEGGSSLAVLEAMQAGLPIVATNIDGIPEDITHNISGLLVPPGNPRTLALTIKKLLLNQNLCHRLGRSAHKAYLQKHSPTLVHHSLSRFLTQITLDIYSEK